HTHTHTHTPTLQTKNIDDIHHMDVNTVSTHNGDIYMTQSNTEYVFLLANFIHKRHTYTHTHTHTHTHTPSCLIIPTCEATSGHAKALPAASSTAAAPHGCPVRLLLGGGAVVSHSNTSCAG